MKNMLVAYWFYFTIAGSTASCLACAFLIDSSLKGMLWMAIAVAAFFLMVRASAATKHLFWSATMLGLLLLPVFGALLPEWRVLPDWLITCGPSERTTQSADAINCLVEFTPSTNVQVFARASVSDEAALSKESIASKHLPDEGPRSVVDLDQQVEPLSTSPPFFGLSTIKLNASFVLVVWITGVLIAVFPMIFAVLRLRGIERQYKKNVGPPPSVMQHVASVSKMLGIPKPIVLLGPEDAMPMVWTFIRSRLLLPSDAMQWSRSKLNAVLLHELIHLCRRDPYMCTIALIARALNWFNPLAWYAVKRLRIECEHACDDHVLRMGVEPSDYASYLLALSAERSLLSAARPVAIAMASRKHVEDRIVAILNEQQNRRSVTLRHVCLTIVAGSFFATMLAAVAVRKVVAFNPQGKADAISKLVRDETATSEPKLELQQERGVTKSNGSTEKVGDLEQEADPTLHSKRQQDYENQEFLDLSLEECISNALTNCGPFLPLPIESRSGDTDYSEELKARNGHSAMRVRGSVSNRVPTILRSVNEDITGSLREERILQITREVEFAYWDLHAAYLNVDAAKSAVESAAGVLKKLCAESGDSSENSEAQVRLIVQYFEANLDAAIDNRGSPGCGPGLYGCEQRLRRLVGWTESDGRLIRPCDKPTSERLEFDWESIRVEMQRNNIDLRNQNERIKQREKELISAKERSIPNTDTARTALRSNSDLPFSNSGTDKPTIDVVKKQILLTHELKKLKAKEHAALVKLSHFWRQIDSSYEQITLSRQAFVALERWVEINRVKFESGDYQQKSDVVDQLLRAQQSRLQASQWYIRALTEYNKLIVELHCIKGSIMEYNNIQLEITPE